MAGIHNVSNAVGSYRLPHANYIFLWISSRKVLLAFEGTDRRFEYKGQFNGVTVIDDYAHHPTEIKATLHCGTEIPAPSRSGASSSHILIRRTKAFDSTNLPMHLSLADKVVLADIYAARETDTLGHQFTGHLQKQLLEQGKEAYYFPSFEEIEKFLLENCINGDLLITMGAGDVVFSRRSAD